MPDPGAAVVTGAGAGIGRACATALAGAGHPVVVADIDGVAAEGVAAAVRSSGGEAVAVPADMRDVGQIGPLMEAAAVAFGRIGVLVNNAAVTRVIDLFDVGPGDWDQILEVNARGYFFALQEAARRMRGTGGGSIVNVASIAGKGFRDTTNIAYASSKGAVITMTRIAAARLGPDGIRVNAVCPGMTKTEMWSAWVDGQAAGKDTREDVVARLEAGVPLQQLNDPADVAATVVFLAGERSRTITGQSINVDGGTIWD